MTQQWKYTFKYQRNLNLTALQNQDVSQSSYSPSYSTLAGPGPASQVHLRNWDLLFSHMLLSPSLITVCVFLDKIYVSVVQCVFVQCVFVCVTWHWSPLFSCWMANQELLQQSAQFYPSLSLSFSLLIHFVWPFTPSVHHHHHHHPALEWTAWNNPASLSPSVLFCFFSPGLTDRSNRGSLIPVLTLLSIHWYASGISVTVIPLMTPLESLTPSPSEHRMFSCPSRLSLLMLYSVFQRGVRKQHLQSSNSSFISYERRHFWANVNSQTGL